MFEVSHSSKNHRNIILVGRINRILIMDRSARLNDRGDTCFMSSLNTICKGEESIRCHHAPCNPISALANSIFQRPDSTYLSGTNPRGAIAMALDLVCFTTFNANNKSSSSFSEGRRWVTYFNSPSSNCWSIS